MVFSTSQVNAALDFNQQLANRLETILTVYSTGSSKQVNSARQIYVRSKDSDVAVVKGMQEFLVKGGYLAETKSNGKSSIDGSFGSMTKEAVKKFQSANGLVADGIIGKQTATAMNQAIYSSPETANIPEQVNQEVADVGAISVEDIPDANTSFTDNTSSNAFTEEIPANANIEDMGVPQNLASSGFSERVSELANSAKEYYQETVKEISDYIKSFNDEYKDEPKTESNEYAQMGDAELGAISRSPETSTLDKLKAGEEIYKRALENPSLRREGETEQDLQKKLDSTQQEIAKLEGQGEEQQVAQKEGELPETITETGSISKEMESTDSKKDSEKLAEHGNINGILYCTDGHTKKLATPDQPQSIEDKKPTRFLLTTTAEKKPRVLQELVPKAKIGCYVESPNDFNGPGGRYCCIETNKDGLCTKTFKDKSEASGFFKTDASLCKTDGIKQKMVETINIPVNKQQ